MKLYPLLVAGLVAGSTASAALVITNGSFESASDDGGGNLVNLELIDSWFEEVGSASDPTEQALQSGGNRPVTDFGDYWGHLIDTENQPLAAMYQSVGTYNVGDPTLYTLSALLGERSNRDWPTTGLDFEFYGVTDAGSPADGTTLSDAFTTETLLASVNVTEFNGVSGVESKASWTSGLIDLSSAADGAMIYLRIAHTSDAAEATADQTHILVDNVTLTAIPEPSVLLSLLTGALLLVTMIYRRRL